ncbi:MAG TPA: branched-chain amino acid ABC transporter permease [Caldilineae bacterium]|nr:branched-chain amino acid ABC transporter permease [Caldilineae bacterium]
MLLSIGFTFAYLTAKVPNFAHGANAAIGIYVTFTVVKILGLNPYVALLLVFPICGTISALIYRLVIQPLKKRQAGLVSLSVATIAAEMMIFAAINIYADYMRGMAGQYSRVFLFRKQDFEFMGVPGVLLVSTALAVSIVILLHTMLTKTKFGIATRATVENDDLASTLGIDTELVSLVSWFITGGLAGIAGSLLPLWFQSTPYTGTLILISVFSASVVGGMASIYGAMVGGYLMGLTEVLGTILLMDLVGSWVAPYRPLIPLIAMFIILLRAPEGLVGLAEKIHTRQIRASISGMFTLARGRGSSNV